MTRETLEKKLKEAGVPDYKYNLQEKEEMMNVCVWKK